MFILVCIPFILFYMYITISGNWIITIKTRFALLEIWITAFYNIIIFLIIKYTVYYIFTFDLTGCTANLLDLRFNAKGIFRGTVQNDLLRLLWIIIAGSGSYFRFRRFCSAVQRRGRCGILSWERERERGRDWHCIKWIDYEQSGNPLLKPRSEGISWTLSIKRVSLLWNIASLKFDRYYGRPRSANNTRESAKQLCAHIIHVYLVWFKHFNPVVITSFVYLTMGSKLHRYNCYVCTFTFCAKPRNIVLPRARSRTVVFRRVPEGHPILVVYTRE